MARNVDGSSRKISRRNRKLMEVDGRSPCCMESRRKSTEYFQAEQKVAGSLCKVSRWHRILTEVDGRYLSRTGFPAEEEVDGK